MIQISRTLCFIALSPLAHGCAYFQSEDSAPTYTEQDLADDLAQYAARFSSIVAAAADDVADQTDSRRVRRSTLIWKLRLIPLLRDAAFQDDPQEAYIEVLALTVAMKNYLSDGDGHELFGEHPSIASEAARELESEVLAIGPRFLKPAAMERLTAQVEELVRKNPIRGRDFSIDRVQVGLAKVEPGTVFDWAISIPMSPFRAFEGVGSGAVAMHDFNRTAAEFAEILDELPRQNRWQIELLLYDLEDRDTVVGGLDAFQKAAEAAERTSLAVEKLPDKLRDVLADTKAPIAEANEAVVNAQKLMEPFAASVREIRQIAELVANMRKESAEVPVDPPSGRPFDVREYEDTAKAVSVAVGELRGLVGDVRDLVESEKFDASLIRAVDSTEDEIAKLLDRATVLVVIVLVAFFAVLLIYRWTTPRSRLTPTKTRQQKVDEKS